jgi:hypothetical protein
MMMEAVSPPELSVTFHLTTQRNIPEDCSFGWGMCYHVISVTHEICGLCGSEYGIHVVLGFGAV